MAAARGPHFSSLDAGQYSSIEASSAGAAGGAGGSRRERGREGDFHWLFKNENPLSRGWWELKEIKRNSKINLKKLKEIKNKLKEIRRK